MSIIIRSFNKDYFHQFVNFIREFWRNDHPISDINLFLWQYKGYDNDEELSNSIAVFDSNRFIGFRMVIPLLFQSFQSGIGLREKCFGSAMWMINPEYRGRGIGLKLHNYVENNCEINIAIGANPNTSVPIYRRSGYHELSKLHRYIYCNDNWEELLFDNSVVVDYSNREDNVKTHKIIQPIEDWSFEALEKLWIKFSYPNEILGIYRSSNYWKWRYYNNYGFKYLLFGNPNEEGVIIARSEKIIHQIDNEYRYSGRKVFRIIELIPSNYLIWKGVEDTDFAALLSGVLTWARVNNHIAVDFYNSSLNFSNLLFSAGFKLQGTSMHCMEFPSLFQPIEKKIHSFNLFLRYDFIDKNDFDFNKTYIVRSDTDQDRPNLLGFYE